MEMKLSISVLVSDRTGSADKCLKSLTPILNEIPSELIVVYTGTNPLSLEIAKKYTENIIPFTWCDDFSKARNVGLKKSSGEWYMYIDDDEWFEDCGEIVDFFKSGEYKKYNSAFYQVRNYTDLDGRGYLDTSAGRMIKRTADKEFVGLVHEHFNLWLKPIKNFQCFVHHYGYARGGKDNEKESSERNVPLLIKQIENEPENIQCRIQLIQEYHRLQEYEKAEHVCRYVMEQTQKNGPSYFYQWTVLFLIKSMGDAEKKKDALEEGERLLSSYKFSELYKMNCYLRLIPICLDLKRYKEGVAYARKFILLKNKMEKDLSLWDEQQMLALNRSNTIRESYYLYAKALVCATYLLDIESAGIFLNELLQHEKEHSDHIYKFLENWITLFPSNEKEILALYDGLESENLYVVFQKALHCEKNAEYEKAKELYYKCQSGSKLVYAYKVVLMAVRNQFELPDNIRLMDLDEWKSCAQQMAEIYEARQYLVERDSINRLFFDYPMQKAVLQQKITAKLIYDKDIDNQIFFDLLTEYCEIVLELNRLLYRDEIFDVGMQFCLPKECRAALEIQSVLDVMSYADFSDISQSLKELIHSYPKLSHIVKRLIDYIELRNAKNPSGEFHTELWETGQKVKEIMKQLAEEEKYAEALEVANKLGELIPEDLEVVRYKQLLLKMT